MRDELVERVRRTLAQAGFCLSEAASLRPMCFDVMARRDEMLLIVKVLSNVDSLSVGVAREMRLLARFLDAKPLLVGVRSSGGDLVSGAVYLRHGIPILDPVTFDEYVLEGVPPLVYAGPGGFYVNVDGASLRRLREERDLSLGELAGIAGVSRRAISMYEEGMSTMVEVAERLEAFFDAPLIEPVDPVRAPAPEEPASEAPLPTREDLVGQIFTLLRTLGFDIVPMERSPFDAFTRTPKTTILTSFAEGRADVERRARVLASFAEVSERRGFFVLEAMGVRKSLAGTPLVGRDEISLMREPGQLVELIEERRKPPRAP